MVPATALPHGRENGRKAEGVEDLKGVAGFVGQLGGGDFGPMKRVAGFVGQ